jgi:outer membrane protein assembly factor BamB
VKFPGGGIDVFTAVQACLKPVAALVVTGVALAACGGDEPSGEAPAEPGGKPASAAAEAYDPPATFGPGLPLGPEFTGGVGRSFPAVLAGRTAVWLGEEGLGGSDAVTGQERWRLPVEGIQYEKGEGATPVFDASSGDPVVYAVVEREVEGTGTVADRPGLLAMAVDPETGEKRWETPIDVDRDEGIIEPRLAAGDGTVAVTNIGNDRPTTFALDAATGKVRWQQAELDVAAVGKGVVAGVRYSRTDSEGEIVGFDAAAGTEKWTWAPPQGAKLTAGSEPRRALPLGPDLVFVPAASELYDEFSGFIDVATGETRHTFTDELPVSTCEYDRRDTLVCGDLSHTVALDAASLRELWQLPGSGRTSLYPTAAFHGAVYGKADNDPVTLDARTGADRPTDPGQAPTEVNEYAGLGVTEDGDLVATFPATG